MGGGLVSTLQTRGRVLSPPPHRHVRGALLPPSPRVPRHAHWQAAPARRASLVEADGGAAQRLLTLLRHVLVAAPCSHGRAPPAVVHYFLPLFHLSVVFSACFVRWAVCSAAAARSPWPSPRLPTSFSFFYFSSTVILPLSITIPRCQRGRACTCLCVTGLAHPLPSPASVASAWPCGPDAARAARGRSLRRGCLSS